MRPRFSRSMAERCACVISRVRTTSIGSVATAANKPVAKPMAALALVPSCVGSVSSPVHSWWCEETPFTAAGCVGSVGSPPEKRRARVRSCSKQVNWTT